MTTRWETVILGGIGFTMFLLPGAASAFRPPEKSCFSSPSDLNAPSGSVITGRGTTGPIAQLMSLIGETRTHVMLWHGNGWASHNTLNENIGTTRENGGEFHGYNACQMPAWPIDLAYGKPGFQAINTGGIYAYWYGTLRGGSASAQINYTTPRNEEWVVFNNEASSVGLAVSDWLYWEYPYYAWHDAGQFWSYLDSKSRPIFYLLDQYARTYPRNIGGGATHMARIGADAYGENGGQCASMMAWAVAQWAKAKGHYGSDNPPSTTAPVWEKQYTTAQTAAAARGMHDGVYRDCLNRVGFTAIENFFGNCGGVGETCERAATQVVNCFWGGPDASGCANPFSDLSAYWGTPNYYAASAEGPGWPVNQTFGARAVSPDLIAGFTTGVTIPSVPIAGWDGVPDTTQKGTAASPWANGYEFQVQWGGPGTTYGCWVD